MPPAIAAGFELLRTPEQLLAAADQDMIEARSWMRLGQLDVVRDLIRDARALRRCARRLMRIWGRA